MKLVHIQPLKLTFVVWGFKWFMKPVSVSCLIIKLIILISVQLTAVLSYPKCLNRKKLDYSGFFKKIHLSWERLYHRLKVSGL